MTKKEKSKKFYVEDDKSVADIATALNITKGAVYYHKKSDLDKGVDWDELRYIASLDPKDTQDKEKIFLSVLIKQFDKALVDLAESDLIEKLELIEGYAKTYYKLKIPDSKIDAKVQKTQVVKDVITKIINIAIQNNNQQVAEFLSANSDEIMESLLKSA